MSSEVIRGEKLSKRYEINPERHSDATLRDAIAKRAKDSLQSARAVVSRNGSPPRHDAGAIWALLTMTPGTLATPPNATTVIANDMIDCPTLKRVLTMARAEWTH